MGKPRPLVLRERVVAHVAAGHTHSSAAARFVASVTFVNDMVKLHRESGALSPRRQGKPGIGKLTPYKDCIRAKVAAKSDITLDEPVALLVDEKQIVVHRASIWRQLKRLSLIDLKPIWPSEPAGLLVAIYRPSRFCSG